MPAPRVLVTTTNPPLQNAATSAFAEAGCEVQTADGGVDCIEKARASVPDLLVLLPPLLWGSVAGVLAVLHDDPATRRVPVLIVAPPADESPVRTPQLLQPHASEGEGTEALLGVIERACSRLRGCPTALPAVVP